MDATKNVSTIHREYILSSEGGSGLTGTPVKRAKDPALAPPPTEAWVHARLFIPPPVKERDALTPAHSRLLRMLASALGRKHNDHLVSWNERRRVGGVAIGLLELVGTNPLREEIRGVLRVLHMSQREYVVAHAVVHDPVRF